MSLERAIDALDEGVFRDGVARQRPLRQEVVSFHRARCAAPRGSHGESREGRAGAAARVDERVAANKRVRKAAGKVRKTAVRSDRRAEFVGDMKNDLGEMMKRARKLETDRTDREDRRSED